MRSTKDSEPSHPTLVVPVRPFSYTGDPATGGGTLAIDGLPLSELAGTHGTPLYLYSAANIEHRLELFTTAFAPVPHTVCYAVKANSSLAILQRFGDLGAGFDIVSGGELERVRRASPLALDRVVFSGVGKQAWEIDAALQAGILLFNVESPDELDLLAARAQALGKQARFALRVNPDVFAETHPYISTGLREHKFGIDIALARELYRSAARHPSLLAVGVSVHIGSQIRAVAPFAQALSRVISLVHDLRSDGHDITYIDAGGGLGIDYTAPIPPDLSHPSASSEVVGSSAPDVGKAHQEPESQIVGEPSSAPEPALNPKQQVEAYAQALLPLLSGLRCHLLLEPGRFLVAQAGGLLTRVLGVKENGRKRFVVTDAAMNDLIRPALYQAHHEILPVTLVPPNASAGAQRQETVDVVGPVCESGDFFARDRVLPPLAPGDLVVLLDAGAYGMSLTSNYNTRPRPPEVLVEGNTHRLIRRRETHKDLFAPELL